MRVKEQAWRRVGQRRLGGSGIGHGAGFDIKLPSPLGAHFGRLATVELQGVEKSALGELAQQRIIRLDHHGDAPGPGRQTADPPGSIVQAQGAFGTRIKIETQRVGPRLDSRERVFLSGHTANFYPRATAAEPTPQARGDHD